MIKIVKIQDGNQVKFYIKRKVFGIYITILTLNKEAVIKKPTKKVYKVHYD